MNKKTVYIDGAIVSTNDRDLNLESIVNDALSYLQEKGLIFGGSINYEN